MPRDRVFENKVLDETSAFLEKILKDFEQLDAEGKILFKEYFEHLPAKQKLARLRMAIERMEYHINCATNHARRERIWKGQSKLFATLPLSIDELNNTYAKFFEGRRGDCY